MSQHVNKMHFLCFLFLRTENILFIILKCVFVYLALMLQVFNDHGFIKQFWTQLCLFVCLFKFWSGSPCVITYKMQRLSCIILSFLSACNVWFGQISCLLYTQQYCVVKLCGEWCSAHSTVLTVVIVCILHMRKTTGRTLIYMKLKWKARNLFITKPVICF